MEPLDDLDLLLLEEDSGAEAVPRMEILQKKADAFFAETVLSQGVDNRYLVLAVETKLNERGAEEKHLLITVSQDREQEVLCILRNGW